MTTLTISFKSFIYKQRLCGLQEKQKSARNHIVFFFFYNHVITISGGKTRKVPTISLTSVPSNLSFKCLTN